MVFNGVLAVDEKGVELYQRLPGESGIIRPYERLLRRCFIWSSALMMRRSYAEQGFIFDETLTKNQEWDLELRLLAVSRFYAINEPLTILHMGETEQLGGAKNLPRYRGLFLRFNAKKYVPIESLIYPLSAPYLSLIRPA